MLIDCLQKLFITSVIRPRIAAGGHREADMYDLLRSTSTCSSPEELAQVIGQCPITNCIVSLGDPANHLRVPEVIQSLFQDHQKFMFFFEAVAELFFQQNNNNPHEILDFVHYLLRPDSRLRLSLRFLAVVTRSVLSTRNGISIIHELLTDIQCNQLTCDSNANHQNLLRALLACADQDVQQNVEDEPAEDVIRVAAMTEEWTVDRIRRLASIRKQLTRNGVDATANVIAEWGRWQKNQNDRNFADSLLFFVLCFSSSEGDQTRLSILFRHEQVF